METISPLGSCHVYLYAGPRGADSDLARNFRRHCLLYSGCHLYRNGNLKATIADIRKSLEKVQNTAADIDRFANLIQKYTSFEELDRFMLNELIDRITLYETPGMGRYRKGKENAITICYKFVGTLQ